ncbi:STAS domain-containing protein [Streptomyces virginiae]|uniref:STAS domain-containing protein n=1 Tax=Streptomyces virginiae TaxID=1961 RepID=UPI0036FEAF2F
MERDLRIVTRRFGPTVHLAPDGELDLDSGPVLDEALTVLDENVVIVVCDMTRLRFLDVTGMHALHDLAVRLHERGLAFFAFGWQAQPQRLLNIIDSLYPSPTAGSEPTALLRRSLRDAAASQRAAGAAAARANAVVHGTPQSSQGVSSK